MADNTTANPGTGGDVFAAKDIVGIKYPRNILTTPSGVDVTPLAEGGNVAVSNFPATQPVSIASMPSTPVTGAFWQATQPVSGPLTDAQLRLSAVPVSLTSTTITGSVAVTGTFWQATQPVSGSVTVNTISGFATEATLAARIPVNGQALMAASVPVTLASNQSALPVTGTFWQTTQPVSLTSTTITGTVAVTQSGAWSLSANQSVNVAQIGGVATSMNTGVRDAGTQRVTIATNDSVPVTGTFWQTTQPVSGTFWQATQPVSLTSTTITGTVAVTAPTLTKGTQAANGFSVQELKDAGRNARAFMLDAYTAAPVAEALQTVVQWYGNAAVAGTTTPAVVPAGKTLRLTTWAISTKSLATVGSAVLRIRANTTGVAVIGSPLVWSAEVGSKSGATTVAMTGGLDTITGVFPEGFEFPAGTGLGFTLAGYGPTGTLTLQGVTRFQVYGYEY